ncbi:unnamed protein product [Schistocephalus solidus]|uniref:Uncharacterized protein n=1 Tax=Schistocephalus solidus TaxID=70667 RepID=A0A183SFP8_SCHSO|nr:unnamed protein product [Schistocephalus solidus]
MDNDCVFEILRDLPLVPHLLEEHCESVYHLESTMLLNLCRNRVQARCFPAGELLHGSDGFWERGREIKVGIGFHFRQAIDGVVGDGGELVENALKVFCPSRQDLCLLSEQRPAIGTEKRGSAFDGRSVDSLGGGEEVLSFASIHEPLDFLGFARHLDITHIPTIDVGLVQLVLLHEQSVDRCVVVIEPVLVLTMCAAEDIQGMDWMVSIS